MSIEETPFQRLTFHGNGKEYFGIWFSNLALSILTLGIYSAWAKVRRMRYMLGNTEIAGAALQYHATGKQIFIGRLISFALILLYSMINQQAPLLLSYFILMMMAIFPLLMSKGLKFRFRMISWNNVHFRWQGNYSTALKGLLPFYIAAAPILFAPMFFNWGFIHTGEPPTMAQAEQFTTIMLTFLVFFMALFPWAGWRLACTVMNNLSWGSMNMRNHTLMKKYYLTTLIYLYIPWVLLIAGATLTGIFAINPSESSNVGWITLVISFVALICILLVYLTFRQMIRALLINNLRAYGHEDTEPMVYFASRYHWRKLIGINAGNFALSVLSLGLLIPWATIRLEKYLLENTAIHVDTDTEQMLDHQREEASALAAEYADMEGFDFDPW